MEHIELIMKLFFSAGPLKSGRYYYEQDHSNDHQGTTLELYVKTVKLWVGLCYLRNDLNTCFISVYEYISIHFQTTKGPYFV